MTITAIYLAAIIFSAHCTNEDDHNAAIGRYPWVVRLVLGNDFSIRFGSGALLSDRYVLTAAHVFKHEADTIKIYLGEYDTETYPLDCYMTCIYNERHLPEKILKHENYDPTTKSNDIALLRLSNRANLTDNIQPISLPPFDVDNEKYADNMLTILGWGTIETINGSIILQEAEIYRKSRDHCTKIFSDPPPEKHMCGGGSLDQNGCPGDEGSPLLMHHNDKYYISGILSYGSCRAKTLSFTNVFKYKDWIEKNMAA